MANLLPSLGVRIRMTHHPTRAMLCDRTREWAALRLDAELSEFETAIMTAHLDRCQECRAFAADVATITRELRSTPLEPPPRPIELGAPRRFPLPRRHLQFAAAAALVVLAAGLGSLYGSLRASGSPEQILTPLVRAPMVATPTRRRCCARSASPSSGRREPSRSG